MTALELKKIREELIFKGIEPESLCFDNMGYKIVRYHVPIDGGTIIFSFCVGYENMKFYYMTFESSVILEMGSVSFSFSMKNINRLEIDDVYIRFRHNGMGVVAKRRSA